MATRSPRAKPRFDERARDALGHGVELGIGELARHLLAAEIDDRDLGEIAVALRSDRRDSGNRGIDHAFGGGGGAVK